MKILKPINKMIVPLYQESTRETTIKDNSNKKLKNKLRAVYSGGAYGADGIWDSMLRKLALIVLLLNILY